MQIREKKTVGGGKAERLPKSRAAVSCPGHADVGRGGRILEDFQIPILT